MIDGSTFRPNMPTVFGGGKGLNIRVFSPHKVGECGFRTTEADKRPARKVFTAQLLGDPAPDRVVPDIPRTAAEQRFHHSQPLLKSPINLTFAQSRAAFGITDQ